MNNARALAFVLGFYACFTAYKAVDFVGTAKYHLALMLALVIACIAGRVWE